MKLKKIISLCLLITSLLLSLNFRAVAAENFSEGYADIVAPLLPAVVNISIISKNHNSLKQLHFPEGSPFEEFNKLFERFDLNQEEDEGNDVFSKPLPAGSGFLVSADGYIVTNYHVVEHADKVVVTLSDDKKLDATIIGYDNRTDLALLKVTPPTPPLPFVKFGNSNQSRVGDSVIAIGNPFGLGGTVTAGIISAQARDIGASSLNIIDNFIQTDAAVNQGNSGGPMFNTKGEVIGINFAIVSPTGNNIGIGFAIPSSVAQPIIEQLIKTGKVSRGWLGVAVQPTDTVSESLGLAEGVGALVSGVTSGSSAEKSGIEVGDVILKFDGKDVTSSKKLPRIVAETPVGKKVNVEIMSKGKRKTISLTVGEMDNSKDEKADTTTAMKSVYGMNLSEITPELRQKLNIANNINGILVMGLDRKSIASKHGIRKGDVINAINQNLITKPEELFKAVEEARVNKRKSIMLLIFRAGGSVFLSLPVSEK